jgi:hypothetical protein
MFRTIICLVACAVCSGCTFSVTGKDGHTHSYILGFGKVETSQAALGGAKTVEISGIGLSVGQLTQFGYFKNFTVQLDPSKDRAVIIINSPEELRNLKQVVANLEEKGLCVLLR